MTDEPLKDDLTVKQELKERAAPVEEFLEGCLRGLNIPKGLLDAMEYSLMAGGKRLRPVLCLSFAELFGLDRESAMPFAASLELIHTYSLIHDDLPAMDDDDLRRGMPSNHKKFGEATAILAGDGLLTEAFGLMFAAKAPAERVLAASRVLARSAGAAGMVGGQELDMEYTGREGVTLEDLKMMHSMKTGALIRGACESGALLAGASDEDVKNAIIYGVTVGAAFQIVDDILDIVGDEKELGKPVGSDEGMGKVTYPSLMGMDKSRKLAETFVDRARRALEGYDAPVAKFLARLARYIVERVQ